jgi:hypothetical protein
MLRAVAMQRVRLSINATIAIATIPAANTTSNNMNACVRDRFMA